MLSQTVSHFLDWAGCSISLAGVRKCADLLGVPFRNLAEEVESANQHQVCLHKCVSLLCKADGHFYKVEIGESSLTYVQEGTMT